MIKLVTLCSLDRG